jgi:hypothetical protein
MVTQTKSFKLPKNFPPVDNGSVYKEITKVIKNNEFVFDLDNQISMLALQKMLPEYPFTKVADCVLNVAENFLGKSLSRRKYIDSMSFQGNLVDYIPVADIKALWDASPKEWVYTIVYNGKIVKIGMTSSGLSSRYTSYKSGTTLAMIKGSCATTNFVVTQCNYLALLKNIKVEIFAYEIPQLITEQIIFGKKEKVLNKVAHQFESTLINIYKDSKGYIPPLCG